MTRTRLAGVMILCTIGASASWAQSHPIPLPLPTGAVVVQTLSFTGGERESFMSLDEVSDQGFRYGWQFREVKESGDTIQQRYGFLEGAPDLLTATRLWAYHSLEGPHEHPGYTMMAISRPPIAVSLPPAGHVSGDDPESPGGAVPAAFGWLGGRRAAPVRYRGTLSLAGTGPAGFPLLVSGRRVEVPALHLRANLTARGRTWTPEFWVLADTTYPLLLKWVGAADAPENVLQTVRIDLPVAMSGEVGRGQLGGMKSLEGALASDCRVELPGIYFAFNSADLEPASDPAIAALGDVLAGHPDWTGTIEGHTDSVGTAAANLTLSERRAAAVRTRLVGAHRVDPARLATQGFGSSRPREPNATIEGRARNRRVELVRSCPGR